MYYLADHLTRTCTHLRPLIQQTMLPSSPDFGPPVSVLSSKASPLWGNEGLL